jgi:putative DNA methylase
LDPTAGGGSIPLESARLGLTTVANDLNPVAALLLKTTVELPIEHGKALLHRYEALSAEFLRRFTPILSGIYGPQTDETYLWARTVTCPYCGGVVPLSPNWRLSGAGYGARLQPENGRIRFEIVEREAEHSPGTVKGGDGACPFPECRRTIDGDEIKAQAQSSRMGHQLYCVVYREERIKGYTKNGKPKIERIRRYRVPRLEDDVAALVQQRLNDRMPLWRARNIIPDEEIDALSNYDRGHRLYGINHWTGMFSPRQLYSHCVGVEVFHDMVPLLSKLAS